MPKKMNTRRRSRRGKRARKYRGGEITNRKADLPNPTDSAAQPQPYIPPASAAEPASDVAPTATNSASEGGRRRKTRKMSTGADTWREGVMRVYKELKAKKPSTRFGDALKEASRRKKAGNL